MIASTVGRDPPNGRHRGGQQPPGGCHTAVFPMNWHAISYSCERKDFKPLNLNK